MARHVINDLAELSKVLNASNEDWVAIDTETTGLHLKKDRPFLLTLSVGDDSYAVILKDYHPLLVQAHVFDNLQRFKFVVGHNVKFDLHMLLNYGVVYTHSNLTDTMILARLGLDTDETMTLRLKVLAKRYLSSDKGDDEKVIKSAMMRLTKELKREVTYEDIFNDPRYHDAMLDYAMNDTEITLALAKKMYEVLKFRNQEPILKIENELIIPLLEMERVGLKIDRDYLTKSYEKLSTYIETRQKELEQLCNVPISVGQHALLKKIYLSKWGIELTSTDDSAMQSIPKDAPVEAKLAADLISELRTLLKWKSTYIERMLEKSEFDGRAYTQVNANSAVTGRLSSDFQQFPKNALLDRDGNELFHPRRMVLVSGDGYDKTAYLDYSQVELRVQANYTYEISGGDLNMCRAYMPHQCHDKEGNHFDPVRHKNAIFSREWYTDESTTLWKPTDLHSATTMQAFPNLDPTSPEFKKMRSLGKATNFAKNYGATKNALIEQFGFEDSVAEALDRGYYAAFPKVLDYQTLVRKIYYQRGYVKNMYGRRYYMTDKRFVYRLYNYLVQGTCADMLKIKIREVHNLLKHYKTRFQMNIHDEMSFEVYNGEEFLIDKIKAIMEDTPNLIVPIVAEVEITSTNWAEKGH